MPKLALTDSEILNCFNVMLELRPHLEKDAFLSTIREMETSGYKLVYIEENGDVTAVAGYRISSNLFMGKHLYVDDLVTSNEARSKGYGNKLMQWLREEAIRNNCNILHLDSGTQRKEAHKFYFREGLTIASFHFSEQLEKPAQ